MATKWKAINDQAPNYIQQLLYRKPQLNHYLRSSNKLLLSEPVSQNRNKFEARAFSFVAPKLWNSLPDMCEECNHSRQLQEKLEDPSITQVLSKLVNCS